MKLDLTNGSARILAELSAAPGMLTAADALFRVGAFAESQLSNLPQQAAQPGSNAQPADWQAWSAETKAWNLLPIELEATERQRDALKLLVKAAIEKGAMPATAATATLLRALGLQPED
jgi:hypothetical protein